MKVHKMVCIDYELAQKLHMEANASALINTLLLSHYKDLRPDEEIIAEVKAKIQEKQDKIKNDKLFQKKLEKRIAEMKKTKKRKLDFGEHNGS